MHDTSLLEYVLARLDETKGQWREIAEASGVPYDTLTKVAQRRNANPRVGTVQQLADYFRAQRAAA
jgi:predicted transcriptional regulator